MNGRVDRWIEVVGLCDGGRCDITCVYQRLQLTAMGKKPLNSRNNMIVVESRYIVFVFMTVC